MTRDQYITQAEETLDILRRGRYTAVSGRGVDIGEWLQDSVSRTRLYHPYDFPVELNRPAQTFTTTLEVTQEQRWPPRTGSC